MERHGGPESGRARSRRRPSWHPSAARAAVAFYVATGSGALWRLPFGSATWEDDGSSAGAVSLAGMNGRLFALDASGVLRTRIPGAAWAEHAVAVPGRVLTAHAGLLVTAGPGDPLRWRPVR
ncbi:hypothetical protein ACWDLG_06990 [Nonomuraea sp. NPDC003727]